MEDDEVLPFPNDSGPQEAGSFSRSLPVPLHLPSAWVTHASATEELPGNVTHSQLQKLEQEM